MYNLSVFETSTLSNPVLYPVQISLGTLTMYEKPKFENRTIPNSIRNTNVIVTILTRYAFFFFFKLAPFQIFYLMQIVH